MMKNRKNGQRRIPGTFLVACVIIPLCMWGWTGEAANTEEEAYTIAVGLYNDGLIDLARDQFQNFLTQFPESSQRPYIQFLLGECDYRQQKHEAAIQAYRKGITEYPGNVYIDQMYYKLGRAYFQAEKYKSAQTTFQEFVENYSHSSLAQEAYYWLGETYFRRGKYQEAADAFLRLIEQFPDYEQLDYAYYSLGWSQLNTGLYEQAISSFSVFLKTFPAVISCFRLSSILPEVYSYSNATSRRHRNISILCARQLMTKAGKRCFGSQKHTIIFNTMKRLSIIMKIF